MKKFVLMMAIVGLLAGSASAAQLWMSFPGSGGDPAQAAMEYTLATSETVDIDVYFQMNAGDTLSTLAFANELATGLDMTASQTPLAGWQDTSSYGIVGQGATQVAWSSLPGSHLVGPSASVLIGTYTIHQLAGTGNVDYDIAFNLQVPLLVWDVNAAAYTLLPTGNAYTTYAGYYHIGPGSPGYTTAFGPDPREALVLHHIPEPGSLALLALGGLALLRRRS